IRLNASQKVPVSAPLIIPFVDEKESPVLYAFWLKDRDDRTILFKTSADGANWPMENRSFTVADNERANRESGLSGLVMRTIIEGSREAVGPPRLFILFLTDNPAAGQQNTIFAKSINTRGAIEAADIELVSGNTGLYFSTRESGFAGTKVGATNFR